MHRAHMIVAVASVTVSVATLVAQAGVANYTVAGLSGNAPQWNGVGTSDSLPLPAVRGAGLALGGGLNQFAATGIATSPALSLAGNDYVRFGYTLSQSAGAEFVITGFRATVGSFGTGSTGMQYQVWGAVNNQPLVALNSPTPMNAPGTPTPIVLSAFTNLITFPGDTAEVRVYFWGAAQAQNGIAFIDDGNAGLPDVEVSAIPIPAPAGALLLACGLFARRRRR